MFNKLRNKLHKLTKSKKQTKKKYKVLHKKLQDKLHKLDGKSQEEIFILKKIIEKIEKKL